MLTILQATLQSLFSYLDQIYVAKRKELQDIGYVLLYMSFSASHSLSGLTRILLSPLTSSATSKSQSDLDLELHYGLNTSERPSTYQILPKSLTHGAHRSQHPLRACIPKLMTHIATFGQYSVIEQFYIDMTREQDVQEVQDLIGSFGGHSDIEKFYINITGGQYSKQVQDLIDRGIKSQDYFEHVRKRIQEETARSVDVLPPSKLGRGPYRH